MTFSDDPFLEYTVLNAPIGICILNAATLVTENVNDKFLEIAGKPYEDIFGKFYWDSFAEARPYYEAALNNVVQNGVAYHADEVEMMLIRHGKEEIIFVTFVYVPVKNKEGKINKVAVWVLENTSQVVARQEIFNLNEELKAKNKELATGQQNIRNMIRQAPVGMCLVSGSPLFVEEVNDVFLEIIGKRREQFYTTPYWDVNAEAKAFYEPITDKVMASGETYHAKEHEITLIRNGVAEMVVVDFVYEPMQDADDQVTGIMIVATEVTDKVLARRALEQTNEEMAASNEELIATNEELAEANKNIERLYETLAASETKLDQMIARLPASISVLTGPDLVVESTNASNLAYWQKTRDEVIGKPLLEILPELADQPFPSQLRQVMATGETIVVKEGVVNLELSDGSIAKTYVDYSYQQVTDKDGHGIGVLVMSNDVSEKVESRRMLEQLNEEAAASNEELTATNEELFAIQGKLRNEQARLERFFMQAPAGICILNGPELIFELVNPLYQQIFPGRKVLGKPMLEALPEVKDSPIWDILQEVYRSGKTFEGKELLIPLATTDDSPVENRYFDFIYQARLNELNEVDGILVFVIDVTLSVQTKQEIKQNAEKYARLAAIVSSTDDTVLSKTLAGIITSWNAAAERMFGYKEAETLGKHISLIIPPSRISEEDFIISQVKAGKKVEHFETVRVAKDGREIPISLTVSPIFDEYGSIIGASKIARDISERQKDELRKNDFIGMVSHELKTPLTSLTALIQVTKNKLAKSEDTFLAGAMTKAETQVKKMSKMINGFLNISRLESGKIAIDKQFFDMAELIHEVEQEVHTTYSSHEIVFAPVAPTPVNADPDKIGHVINNLINNAVKYSPARSTIKVACVTINGMAQVSISDQGIGISARDAAHLFDRYYRVEDVNTKHISGFGIGLYLSAEIITRHEGKIWVESEPGLGSTFYFNLQVKF